MTNNESAPGADTHLEGAADPIGRMVRAVWWLVLIRGIAAVVFGVLALFLPGVALLAFVFVFAAYALIEGVIEIVHAVGVRGRDRRWGWLLAMGVIGVLGGLFAFFFPLSAGLVIGTFVLALIAFYAVAMGIAGFPAAASMTNGGRKALGYIVSVLSVVIGVVLAIITLVAPGAAVLNLIWLVGVWAIIIGVTLILAAISARATLARAARPGGGAAPAQG